MHFHIIQKWQTNQVFSCSVHFLVRKIGINSEKCIEYDLVATVRSINPNVGTLKELSDLPDVNINTGTQSINSERASLSFYIKECDVIKWAKTCIC